MSGQLDDSQRQLLLKHYEFYRSLHHGQRSPITAAQRHFVAVCSGEQDPDTEHEHVYLKFLSLLDILDIDATAIIAADFRFPTSSNSDNKSEAARSISESDRPCSDCGRPIPQARLDAIPSASRCIECQQGLEERGGGDKPIAYDAGEAWFPRSEHWRYRGRG